MYTYRKNIYVRNTASAATLDIFLWKMPLKLLFSIRKMQETFAAQNKFITIQVIHPTFHNFRKHEFCC